jgi:hypothetical protein
MFFYALMTPVLVAMIFMIHRLRAMAKHDRVLHRLCELRREMMAFLRKNPYSLTREEYHELRELIELTNTTIHNYNAFKKEFVGIGPRIEYGRKCERMDKQIHNRQVKSEFVSELYQKFTFTMFIAVLTFIPWPKLAIKITPVVLYVVTRIGITYLNTRLKRMAEFFSWLRQRSEEYAYPPPVGKKWSRA